MPRHDVLAVEVQTTPFAVGELMACAFGPVLHAGTVRGKMSSTQPTVDMRSGSGVVVHQVCIIDIFAFTGLAVLIDHFEIS